MFKRILLLCFVLLLSASISADITLISPIEKTLQNDETIKLGAVQPGETFELIISRKSMNRKWQDVSVNKELLPANWTFEKKKFDQSFSLLFSVPASSKEFSQNIKVTLTDNTVSESFNAIVNIKRNLVSAGIIEFENQAIVNKPVALKLAIINNSIAKHTIEIKSSLPFYWLKQEKLLLEPKSSIEKELTIYPKVYGLRKFTIFIDSELNNSRFASFNLELNVLPTLRGKYLASFTGFPLFAPSLFPFYLIDAFLAWLS